MRPLVLLLLVPALALAACGETQIDSAEAETFISDTVVETTGARVDSVECPEGLTAKKGATFECKVTGDDGSTGQVPVTEKDAEGNVTVAQPFLPIRDLEANIAKDLERQFDASIELDCPEIVLGEKGATFDCEATSDGKTRTVMVTQKDDTGNVRYELGQ